MLESVSCGRSCRRVATDPEISSSGCSDIFELSVLTQCISEAISAWYNEAYDTESCPLHPFFAEYTDLADLNGSDIYLLEAGG